MQYILTGFDHDIGFRVFAFQTLIDKVRTEYRVRADLGLIRKYGIRMQELPLLCLGVLERRDEAAAERAFTYTEADMSTYADDCAMRAAAPKPRKTSRKPVSENVGAAWRGPQ
jgi:hypothetical protein